MVDRRDSTTPDDGLTNDEVAVVLARAAELDRAGRPDPPRLDDDAVAQIAAEAGIDGAAVRRALAELRAGALPAASGRRGARLSPPRTVRVERAVPGPRATVERELHGWLHRQLFVEVRRIGDRTRFARRGGLLADVQRAIDLRGRLVLRRVQWVEVAVVDEPGTENVLVCLDADCTRGTGVHRTLLWGGGAAGAAGVAVAATVEPALLALLPAGAAAGGGAGHLVGRSVHGRHADTVRTALAGRLDRLEHR